MAANNGLLIQALVDGGLPPATARVIANALANAATPQYAQTRDIADATPAKALRMIDADGRRYQFTNLDYSNEDPYESKLRSNPGQFQSDYTDHPYKDAQPTKPVPPLSQVPIKGGAYTTVDNTIQDGAPQAVVNINVSRRTGTHMRVNPATNSVEAVELAFSSPQGLVTATVQESSSATDVAIAVRSLNSGSVVLADGSTARTLYWKDGSSAPAPQVLMPTGAVMALAYSPASLEGWLLCNGAAVSRTTYAALFSKIGTIYGIGDDLTTFNVPDFRGHFLRGAGIHGVDTTAESGALGARQADSTKVPALTGTTNETGAHTHNVQVSYTPSGTGVSYESGNSFNEAAGFSTLSAGAHTHTVTIPAGGATETRPKNIAVPYWIKT